MRSNVEHNFWMPSLSGGAIISCRLLWWGIESNYAGMPYNDVVGANVVASPYDPVGLVRTFHTGASRGRGFTSRGAFKGEMARLFARVRRVDGPRSWIMSLGIFISCPMDSEMAAQSRWVMVVATRGDTTTSQVKREGGTMRGNVQPANTLRGGVATRGDATISRDKQEGGTMRGEAALRRRVERWWRRRGDATTIWGNQEGGASRGHVTTSRHVERVA
jgi:hypothetical protein